MCGAFTGEPAAGLKETVLLNSTKESELVDGMMASMGGASILNGFKPSGVNYKLAIRLTGKFKTAFPEGKPAGQSRRRHQPGGQGGGQFVEGIQGGNLRGAVWRFRPAGR